VNKFATRGTTTEQDLKESHQKQLAWDRPRRAEALTKKNRKAERSDHRVKTGLGEMFPSRETMLDHESLEDQLSQGLRKEK